MHEYSKKHPERGNVVIDENLFLPNRGEIVSGVWDASERDEVFTDVFVKYGAVRSGWYKVQDVEPYWVSAINAYVLNASSESNGEEDDPD